MCASCLSHEWAWWSGLASTLPVLSSGLKAWSEQCRVSLSLYFT